MEAQESGFRGIIDRHDVLLLFSCGWRLGLFGLRLHLWGRRRLLIQQDNRCNWTWFYGRKEPVEIDNCSVDPRGVVAAAAAMAAAARRWNC